MDMRAYDIILKKREGMVLTGTEIEFLVKGFSQGSLPDSQMAAWLMAVFLRGMTETETADLTMSIANSGRTLDLSSIPGIKVDKHSTGGVGDKTTLVLIPLLAAAGLPVVKLSGRCLGHTGGTIDKLEAIPGFSTALSSDEMLQQVRRIGVAISEQTGELAPADKKIYALRDITATVDSVPLIAASIMSKKIAAGADAIILDVKAGSGAFMRTPDEAETLARVMVEIGTQVGRRTAAAVTDMDQPLGRAVGNAIEVREAIETLDGRGPDDLVALCEVLGGMALVLSGKISSQEGGQALIRNLIANGRGKAKFAELIEAQGGDPRVVEEVELLPTAPVVSTVKSPAEGYVSALDARAVAQAATLLGAGRGEAGAEPDLSVGVRLIRKPGDAVSTGEPLAEIHARDEESAGMASGVALGAFGFEADPPAPRALIHRIVKAD